jgi:DNA-directed RNA polymerase subunit RPC12/RpoP
MSEASEFEFVCSTCAQSIEVNGSMRAALIEHGCVICGADVGEDSFEDLDE